MRQSALNKSTNGTPREGAFNVNGLRSTFNNFLIDGVDNNAYGTSNQGFSNQVMQPPPDAVGEFRVVTNNQSAEYGRAAGATVNVAYRSGTNQFHGDALGVLPRHQAERDDASSSRPTARSRRSRRNQFGGVLGGPIVKNKAFFFGDYEGFRQNAQGDRRSRRCRPPRRTPGILQRRHSRSAHRRDVSRRHADPDDRVRAQGARRAAGAEPAPAPPTTTRSLQEFTNDTDKAGGKVDLQISPALSLFGRYGWRDLDTNDQPPIPLPSGGGGNGNIYARNKQLVARHDLRRRADRRCSKSGSAGRTRRAARIRRRSARARSTLRHHRAADRRAHRRRPAVADASPAIPAFGRQATNPQWQYPTVCNPKVNYSWLMGRQSLKAGYEFQHINVEVQDVNPLYGLDSYTGQFTRPAGAAANNIYNLADFMLGLRSQYALSTFLVANMRQNLHFTYVQDDIRVNDKLTLNARPALRVRDADVGSATTC